MVSEAAIPYKFIKKPLGDLTPYEVYQRLDGNKKFLLESTLQHAKKGKFSFIGTNPYQEIIGTGNQTTIIDHERNTEKNKQQITLDYIKENLPYIHLKELEGIPFYGGAVGYIGYDAIRQYENIGEVLYDEINMPDIHLMLYRNTFVIDHENKQLYLIALNTDEKSEAVLDHSLQEMETMLEAPVHPVNSQTNQLHFVPETPEEAFKEKVAVAKEHLHRGDIFQVVLSQRLKADFKEEAFPFYLKLREANPSPYMFYIDFQDYVVLGASPESLVQTRGAEIIANPIAGTRPRGKTKEEDAELENDLLADEKEIAEHRMLVDLSRNDLGRVCEIDSITLPTYMSIEKFQHVMHIVSEVKGKLRQDLSSIDALISCLPAGTVSGAPKIRAMQIINDLEEKKRGAYAGGIGYINFNHDLNLALAIRSLMIKDDVAYLQSGAGIVYDSVPEVEYQETLNKARSLMEVK